MGVPTFQIRHIQRCMTRQSNCSLTVGFSTLVGWSVGSSVSVSAIATPTTPISTYTTVALNVGEEENETDRVHSDLGLREVWVCSLPKSERHVRDPSKRKRFGPNKLHCYLIPVLTRARFGEGLMAILSATHLTTLNFVAEVMFLSMLVRDEGKFPEGLVFWLQQGTDAKALFYLFVL